MPFNLDVSQLTFSVHRFGTFLSHAVNNFSIWALDLGEAGGAKLLEKAKAGEPLNWMRIDPGSVLSKGSWNRAVGWKNSVVVLGDRGALMGRQERVELS